MSPLPTVHVVIVNWNAGSLLAECLRSFDAISADTVNLSRVTVVDNCSSDNSLQAIEGFAANLPLEIVRNSTNRGFGAGCNQGARGTTADYILFLNPDTCLTGGSLEAPAKFLADRKNNSVGIVGIQLVNQNGEVAQSCAREPTAWLMIGQSLGLDRTNLSIFPAHFLTDWDHGDTRIVDQVMGAFFFVRRSVFVKLGGFDERFFVYFEDVDLAVQARALGATSVYLATARAFHRGSGTTEQVKDVRLFYSWRSRILYAFKHFTILGACTVTFVTVGLEPLVRALALIAQMRFGEMKMLWRATQLLWQNLSKMLRGDARSPVASEN